MAMLWITICAASAEAATSSTPIFGWVEWAYIEPHHVHLKAKLDSGAKTSSLSAVDMERFTRDGETWIRFHVPISASDGGTEEAQLIEMERRLEKEVLIKRHGGAPARRPVVLIGVCLGDQAFVTPVTLTDRSRFNYPLLLGRSALRERALLDVSRTYSNGADAERCAADARHIKE
ncbi:MAG: ATP-dependent zinc protease [Proteobacteria bacterium]|nr:ATP-dependent zinc protease [Pseudomonadota bacterium]